MNSYAFSKQASWSNSPKDCLVLEIETVVSSYSCSEWLSLLFECPFTVPLQSCSEPGPNTWVSGVLLRLCALITVYFTSFPFWVFVLCPFLWGDLPRCGTESPPLDKESWRDVWGKALSLWGERPCRSELWGKSDCVQLGRAGLRERWRTESEMYMSTGTSSRGVKARGGGRRPVGRPAKRRRSRSSKSWRSLWRSCTGCNWNPPL